MQGNKVYTRDYTRSLTVLCFVINVVWCVHFVHICSSTVKIKLKSELRLQFVCTLVLFSVPASLKSYTVQRSIALQHA